MLLIVFSFIIIRYKKVTKQKEPPKKDGSFYKLILLRLTKRTRNFSYFVFCLAKVLAPSITRMMASTVIAAAKSS